MIEIFIVTQLIKEWIERIQILWDECINILLRWEDTSSSLSSCALYQLLLIVVVLFFCSSLSICTLPCCEQVEEEEESSQNAEGGSSFVCRVSFYSVELNKLKCRWHGQPAAADLRCWLVAGGQLPRVVCCYLQQKCITRGARDKWLSSHSSWMPWLNAWTVSRRRKVECVHKVEMVSRHRHHPLAVMHLQNMVKEMHNFVLLLAAVPPF